MKERALSEAYIVYGNEILDVIEGKLDINDATLKTSYFHPKETMNIVERISKHIKKETEKSAKKENSEKSN